MKSTEKVCDVCRREMKGEIEPEETMDLCPECNEYPIVAGHDLCALCLKEKLRLEAEEASLLSESEPDIELDGDDFVEETVVEPMVESVPDNLDDDDKDPPSDLVDELEEAFGDDDADAFGEETDEEDDDDMDEDDD